MTQIQIQKAKNLLFNILVFIFFSALTVIMTFPLFFNINSYMPGFSSTDEPSIWYGWWLKYAYIHNISSSFSHLTAVPFGIDLGFTERLFPLWTGIAKFLAIVFNEVFAYNLQVLSGFIFSAFFVYLLAVYLIKDRIAAIFSAIIFAFCPYHFARAWQHLNLAYTQWIPLFLFTIFILAGKINKKNIFFTLLSLYLVFSFDLYYAYFSAIIAAIFIFYIWLKRKKESFRIIFWIGIVYLLNAAILIFNILPLIKTIKINSSPSAWGIVRPPEDLFSQSARPLSYFLPSTEHPIFGWIANNFIGTDIYGMSLTEHSLYLGWVPLILAFVAVRRWRRSRKSQIAGRKSRVTDKESFYIWFFVFLAFMAWLFSQPPWWNIFRFKIYMPSFFMYKILPMFRAYCRFGIVVMLAVAVLAGFGLKYILERFKTQKSKIAITTLFCGLVLFEFWNWPPYKVIDLSKAPAVYYWLKEEPKDFVIAEYPLDADSPNELYKFFQTVHEKKIINGTIPGTYANKVAQTIRRLSKSMTAAHLKWMGVKYVIVHKDDYLKTDLIEDKEDLEKITRNSGLKFVKSFPPQECPRQDMMCVQKTGPIDVYEVVAGPIKPRVKD